VWLRASSLHLKRGLPLIDVSTVNGLRARWIADAEDATAKGIKHVADAGFVPPSKVFPVVQGSVVVVAYSWSQNGSVSVRVEFTVVESDFVMRIRG
jgi:hypothetical protein